MVLMLVSQVKDCHNINKNSNVLASSSQVTETSISEKSSLIPSEYLPRKNSNQNVSSWQQYF